LNRLVGRGAALAFILSIAFSSVPVAAVAVSPRSSAMIQERSGSFASTNWSGYAVNGSSGSITAVQGSWVVPLVSCLPTGTSYAAVWVGIDGFQSSTVEQTGTDSDCVNGVPNYYAWYEFYPHPSFKIGGTVHPGDVMGARVWFSGGVFKVLIVDFTTRQSFSKSQTVSSAARSSAEFIVEAPLLCSLLRCSLASLSDFGTVGFGLDYTGVSMTCGLIMNGVPGAIGAFGSSVQEISMVSQSNGSQVKAQPSALTSNGQGFTVQWLSAGP
jgi:Peptidase A4 family